MQLARPNLNQINLKKIKYEVILRNKIFLYLQVSIEFALSPQNALILLFLKCYKLKTLHSTPELPSTINGRVVCES